MLSYRVATPQRIYEGVIERGILSRAGEYVPAGAGKIFVVTTADVWRLHGPALESGLRGRNATPLVFPGGEEHKRFAEVEALADQMVAAGGESAPASASFRRGAAGGDRTSLVIAFGGGIVNDLGGFLASIFMRGIPVLQIPTTLLAQVDAALGGKTAVNPVSGKNLIGSFHQPLAVLTAPAILDTLPEREYRAGLYEIIKAGIIREPELFRYLTEERDAVIARRSDAVDHIIEESVRMKTEVVSSDEREG